MEAKGFSGSAYGIGGLIRPELEFEYRQLIPKKNYLSSVWFATVLYATRFIALRETCMRQSSSSNNPRIVSNVKKMAQKQSIMPSIGHNIPSVQRHNNVEVCGYNIEHQWELCSIKVVFESYTIETILAVATSFVAIGGVVFLFRFVSMLMRFNFRLRQANLLDRLAVYPSVDFVWIEAELRRIRILYTIKQTSDLPSLELPHFPEWDSRTTRLHPCTLSR